MIYVPCAVTATGSTLHDLRDLHDTVNHTVALRLINILNAHGLLSHSSTQPYNDGYQPHGLEADHKHDVTIPGHSHNVITSSHYHSVTITHILFLMVYISLLSQLT